MTLLGDLAWHLAMLSRWWGWLAGPSGAPCGLVGRTCTRMAWVVGLAIWAVYTGQWIGFLDFLLGLLFAEFKRELESKGGCIWTPL